MSKPLKPFATLLKEAQKLTADALYFYEAFIHFEGGESKKTFPKAFDRYAPSVTVVRTSLFFSLIITLDKLRDDKSKRVTVREIIVAAEKEKFITDKEREEFRAQLAKLNRTEDGVKRLRNNHVGHLSASEQIPETYKIAEVTPKQLEALAKGYALIIDSIAKKAGTPSTKVESRLNNLHQNLASLLTRLNR